MLRRGEKSQTVDGVLEPVQRDSAGDVLSRDACVQHFMNEAFSLQTLLIEVRPEGALLLIQGAEDVFNE